MEKIYLDYAMGPLNETLVSITCILSMLGSLIIIGSYIAWRDIRTISRNILIWISCCDFLIALGNMCGTYFKPQPNDYKCYAQSFIVSAALISSFLWSVTLATCLYMTIIKGKASLFQCFLPYLHIFNWSLGLVINIVALKMGSLGNSADQITAGWCWIKHNTTSSKTNIPRRELLWMLLDYKIIEIVAYASIFFIFLLIKVQLKKEVKARSSSPSEFDKRVSVMKVARKADRKLVIIPVLLILARLPGTIRFFIVAVNKMPVHPTHWSLALMYLQGIGDNAQGFLNCILFCFLQKKVRHHLLEAIHRFFNLCGCRRMLECNNHMSRVNNCSSMQGNAKTPLLEKDKLLPKYN